MKKFLFVTALLITSSAFAADVGVSVSVNQPGLYGRIDIGNLPHPPLLFPAPLIIQRPVHVGEPVYLHVPPGHAKNWRKHCHTYHACGQPVYFVQEDWYNNEYAPRYREKHGRHGHGHGHDDDGDHGEDRGKHKGKHDRD